MNKIYPSKFVKREYCSRDFIISMIFRKYYICLQSTRIFSPQKLNSQFTDAIGFRAVLLSPMDRSKILENSRFEIPIGRPYTAMR